MSLAAIVRILRELGYTDAEIEERLAACVVADEARGESDADRAFEAAIDEIATKYNIRPRRAVCVTVWVVSSKTEDWA